jgi:Ca2+-binding EF-hand superfamily protein
MRGELSQAFDLFDTDQSGEIDLKELKVVTTLDDVVSTG